MSTKLIYGVRLPITLFDKFRMIKPQADRNGNPVTDEMVIEMMNERFPDIQRPDFVKMCASYKKEKLVEQHLVWKINNGKEYKSLLSFINDNFLLNTQLGCHYHQSALSQRVSNFHFDIDNKISYENEYCGHMMCGDVVIGIIIPTDNGSTIDKINNLDKQSIVSQINEVINKLDIKHPFRFDIHITSMSYL